MKPFNLEQAKAGKPVCTRNGKDVRILCYDFKDPQLPILAACLMNESNECSMHYRINGKYTYEDTHEYDLMMKEETTMVNGFEVPKPYDGAMSSGDEYYLPVVTSELFCSRTLWDNDDVDARYMQRGLVHLDRDSAIKHTKAMLGINPYGNTEKGL